MTPSEIAETLINGNISDARAAIVGTQNAVRQHSAVLALDVLDQLCYLTEDDEHYAAAAIARLRRCLTGGTDQ